MLLNSLNRPGPRAPWDCLDVDGGDYLLGNCSYICHLHFLPQATSDAIPVCDAVVINSGTSRRPR